MAKLLYSVTMSLDGFIAGPGGHGMESHRNPARQKSFQPVAEGLNAHFRRAGLRPVLLLAPAQAGAETGTGDVRIELPVPSA